MHIIHIDIAQYGVQQGEWHLLNLRHERGIRAPDTAELAPSDNVEVEHKDAVGQRLMARGQHLGHDTHSGFTNVITASSDHAQV